MRKDNIVGADAHIRPWDDVGIVLYDQFAKPFSGACVRMYCVV